MNRIIKSAAIAAIAAVGVIGTAGAASAYTPPADHRNYVGETVVHDGGSTTIQNVDLNVQLDDGSQWYHEFDLTYTRGVDGVVVFAGVGKQFDNAGEIITGSIDTTNRTVTYTASYLTNGALDGRAWTVTDGVLAGTATSGDIDWTGTYLADQFTVMGGFHNVPAAAPVSVTGNHGQYVSGAVKAGLKGKALAAIAQDVTLVGPYNG